MNNLNNPILK